VKKKVFCRNVLTGVISRKTHFTRTFYFIFSMIRGTGKVKTNHHSTCFNYAPNGSLHGSHQIDLFFLLLLLLLLLLLTALLLFIDRGNVIFYVTIMYYYCYTYAACFLFCLQMIKDSVEDLSLAGKNSSRVKDLVSSSSVYNAIILLL